jgi:hypothetical protein
LNDLLEGTCEEIIKWTTGWNNNKRNKTHNNQAGKNLQQTQQRTQQSTGWGDSFAFGVLFVISVVMAGFCFCAFGQSQQLTIGNNNQQQQSTTSYNNL